MIEHTCHKVFGNDSRYYVVWSIVAILILLWPTRCSAVELESWQSCCGAVCIRTVAGLLGKQTNLAEVRRLLRPNSQGQTSLAELSDAARKMGLQAVGFRVNSQRVRECSVPLIAHMPPNHFVVLLGFGKDAGVTMIDPPRLPRKMTEEELTSQDYWNVLAISRDPISLKGSGIRKPSRSSSWLDNDGAATKYGQLRFANPVWYLGDVRPGATKKHSFSFSNVGTEPVSIAGMKPDCSCVQVTHFTNKLAPGAHGTVEVVLDTTGMLGYLSKQIGAVVRGDQTGASSKVVLKVLGEVSKRGQILLEPWEIYLPDMVKGSVTQKTVSIKRVGYDHLHLKEILGDCPTVSAPIAPGCDRDSYEVQVEVQVKADYNLGPFEHELLVETDYPDCPVAKLRIHGNIVSHIKVEPPELFLGALSQQEALRRTVSLNSQTGTGFKLTNVKTDLDNLAVTGLPADERQLTWKLTVSNRGALKTGILKGNVLVETDDPDLPRIQIPLIGLVLN